MKELMYGAINNTWTPGHTYAIDGFNIIGKTGTAQIFENGHYLTGNGNYLISFSGMFPNDEPEIILYAVMKKPSNYWGNVLSPYVKSVIRNIAKYKNIYTDAPVETEVESYHLSSYMNEDIDMVKQTLVKDGLKVIVIGDGKTIVNQYPQKGTNVMTGDKVFLVTNGNTKKLEKMIGWSKNEFITYMQLLNVPYEITGYGYITEQSIKAGSILDGSSLVKVTLSNKYNLD